MYTIFSSPKSDDYFFFSLRFHPSKHMENSETPVRVPYNSQT